MIRCDNLNLTIGTKTILKNVSFDLSKNQNLLILGANGAGKSSLSKALCGLIPSNNVYIDGKRLNDIEPKQKASLINYVPPKLYSYEEEITAFDFLLLGFFWRKKRFEPIYESEKKTAMELLERFGATKLSKERLATLSSGEKQGLLILQAALQKSVVTIFDEPISNIDATRSQALFTALFTNELFAQKIVITHDLHFAYSLGFDVLYLENNMVDFFGSSESFFAKESLFQRFGDLVFRFDGGVALNYGKK